MNNQEFIDKIANLVIEFAPQFGISVASPIIAQACLESGYGTSRKASFHNYFGLKYRENRVTCHSGYFNDTSSEQKADGTYYPISTDWYAFEDMRNGVKGYFQYISISRYNNLKGITDPHKYLELIREDDFATSLSYVDSVYRVVTSQNLTRFDDILRKSISDSSKKEETNMNNQSSLQQSSEPFVYTNSPLVAVTKLSPNYSAGRKYPRVDTITIHCVVGQVTAERLGDIFAPESRQASSNYGVDKDGRVGMYVEEKNRSWCTGGEIKNDGLTGSDNDQRAITIEVASDTTEPYAVTDKALNGLIALCADICKRNGIPKLVWSDNKEDRIKHLNGCNMTIHRDYAKKSCPGSYLYSKMPYIAEKVSEQLVGIAPNPQPSQPAVPTPQPHQTETKPQTSAPVKHLYRVRKSWVDSKSQLGAFENFDYAIRACKKGYKVFDEQGFIVHSNIAFVAGDNVLLDNTKCYSSSVVDTSYSNKSGKFFVWSSEIINGRMKITNSKDNVGVPGRVTCWVDADSLALVE